MLSLTLLALHLLMAEIALVFVCVFFYLICWLTLSHSILKMLQVIKHTHTLTLIMLGFLRLTQVLHTDLTQPGPSLPFKI